MINYWINQMAQPEAKHFPEFLNSKNSKEVRDFHRSISNYKVTPLVALDGYAHKMGVRKVFVKDESKRYGLNAFKALGALYACFKVVEVEKSNKPVNEITLVTATDGNHGRAVAYAAEILGCRSVVYMPKGSSLYRLNAIKSHGAVAEILDLNYDDAVRYANSMAEKNDWIIVQDTAWEDYTEIPNDIAKGYTTMADEAFEQMEQLGSYKPTHVFLQAGVGSMAGGILGYMVNRFEGDHPITVILEASKADCLYRSMVIGDGKPHAVSGDLDTIMAGLACGEANTITFEVLKEFGHAFLSCDDEVTKLGMRLLAHPCDSDPKVISGESGAVGMGALDLIMKEASFTALKDALKLDQESVILLFSTEGDTDPDSYKRIVGSMD